MNRFFAFLLTLSVIFLLMGCQNEVPPETQPPVQETTIPSTEPTPPETTKPDATATLENLYSVAMPITTEEAYAEDSSLIFSYRYQTMHLTIPDKDVADKIIIDFLGRVEKNRPEAQQLHDTASADHTSAGFAPYSYQIHYNPTRIDRGVLSLHGHISQFANSAHSNLQRVSANYDLVTGDVLTLGSILYRADVKDQLADIVISVLENSDNLSLYDDFRETVARRFERDESTDEAFYFTSLGLCFYFSPYEIAPYSSGTVVAEIPYNQLTGIIGDAFFPVERTYSNGQLSLCPFETADLSRYSQFAEIIADTGATKVLLTTDQIVQDIRIKELNWTENGRQTESNTIFASNGLSSGEAILIDAKFSSEYPKYMVSYFIDGTCYDYYLMQDSETNEIIMTAK